MGVVHAIGIAGLRVVSHPDTIRTVLGSCVGVAIYDRIAKVGGMAHIMLPTSEGCQGDPGKFADTAVDWLVDDMLKAGTEKLRLAAKITGGASMFGEEMDNGLGQRNIVAVRARLAGHQIRLVAEDVGGTKGRRMSLDPANGQVQVQIIGAEPRVI